MQISKHCAMVALSLSLAASSIVSLAPLAEGKKDKTTDSTSRHAKDKERSKGEKERKKSGKKETSKTASATGLDDATLDSINHGDWKEAASLLEARVASQAGAATRDQAWLAFAYLFLGRCDDLKKLSQQVPPSKTAGEANNDMSLSAACAVAVNAVDLTCQNKFADADALLKSLPDKYLKDDAMFNFLMAAVQGKEGHAGAAAGYSQRSTELAPDFAWGFRTLGYLEQKWLKEPIKAEQAYEAALSIQPVLPEVIDNLVDLKLACNDFDGAIDVADAAIKNSPKDAVGYYRLAQIYLQQWRLKESLKELEQAIAYDATAARFYRSRASIRRYQNSLNEAIADQQKAVELSKDKSFDLVVLADMNVAAGNNNRAVDNLEEALKVDAENNSAHEKLIALLKQEKRNDDLIAEYKRAIEKKDKDAGLRLGLASALILAGKRSEAIEQFKQAANLDAGNPEPHRQMAALLVSEKDYELAAREYKYALNINPSSVADMVALGYCYARTDDYTNAEAAFVTALALQQLTQPNTPATASSRLELMRSLAALLFDEGRYSDAASQFESIYASSKATEGGALDYYMLMQSKALRDLSTAGAKGLIDAFDKLPADKQEQRLLSLSDTLIEAGKANLSLPYIEKAAASTKESDSTAFAQLLIVRSKQARLKGDFAQAQSLATQASTVKGLSDSLLSEALLNVAEAQLAKGDTAAASSTATQAVEKYAKNYAAYSLIGRADLKSGNAKEAIAAAKKALELNPYTSKAYLILGDAQTAQGNLKEASASYKRAAELYPGSLEAHRSLLATFKKLALKDEARKEEELIAQLEKQR